MPNPIFRFQLCLLAPLLFACSEVTTPEENYFRISPRTLELFEGGVGSLSLDTDVPAYMQSLFYWTVIGDQSGCPSAGLEYATFNAAGHSRTSVNVHAFKPATLRVQVSYYDAIDTVLVVVRGVPAARMTIEPDPRSVAAGQWIFIYPRVVDSGEKILNRNITWTSSDSSLATVDYSPTCGFSSGYTRIWGLRPGIVTITGAADNLTATATIVITGS